MFLHTQIFQTKNEQYLATLFESEIGIGWLKNDFNLRLCPLMHRGPFKEGKTPACWSAHLIGVVKALTPIVTNLSESAEQVIAFKNAIKSKK